MTDTAVTKKGAGILDLLNSMQYNALVSYP